MLKNMMIGVKLTGGFIIVAVIALIIGIAGYTGIESLGETSGKIAASEDVAKEMLQREIDHLKWVQAVAEFQADESLVELAVEKDNHQCGFGKWYYGEGRKEAEISIPELVSLLEKIEKPHENLHKSAIELEKILKKGRSHRQEAFDFFRDDTQVYLAHVQDLLKDIGTKVRHHVESEREKGAEASARNTMIMIVAMVIGVVMASILGIFLSRSITRPIGTIRDIAQDIAKGDLSKQIDINQKDEIGQLADAFRDVKVGLSEKASAATEVAEGNLDARVEAMCEADILGKAMQTMVQNLKKNKEEVDTAMNEAREKVDYLNNIPTPVMVVDKNMTVKFLNEAGAKAAGSTSEACIGRKCFDLFTNAHCQTAECATARAMQQDGIFTSETLITARGMNLPIMYTGAPIKDHKGEIIGALEYVTDITEIKNAQKKSEKVAKYQEKEVEELSGALGDMAIGDLTVQYEAAHADEDTQEVYEAFSKIQDGMQATLKGLNDILGQVNIASEQIASGSGQVSDSSQSLSQGATEQASSLQEVTSSMTEMSSQTKQNADNASQANQLSASARDNADQGNQQMQQMLTAMGEINESSGQISKIIKVIDEIAFQTNLLALNAAVEAARAGVHGKGFAVVAEEVRNLAQRSAKAAKETTELIEGSTKKVENGTNIANSTAKALEEIVGGVAKVTDLVGEIASASNEQAQGIGQVNEALNQIDQVTQSNTANAEESASASEELSGQASQLQQMLTRFQLTNGNTHRSQAAVAKTHKAAARTETVKTVKAETKEKEKEKEPVPAIALDDKEFGKF